MYESLEKEKFEYEEFKKGSSELQDPHQVNSVEVLFDRVLQQAVEKQQLLERTAIEMQDLGTCIGNMWEVVGEIEGMLSSSKVALSDEELQENIELCQVFILISSVSSKLIFLGIQ